MTLRIADRWFEIETLADGVSHLWEPHVTRLLQCNIWHVRGRDRDLLVDTGLGVASLAQAARHLFDKALTAVATHAHIDHVGSLHEFPDRVIHRAEAHRLDAPRAYSLRRDDHPADAVAAIRRAGYEPEADYLDALPHAGFNLAAFARRAAPATRLVDEGDVVDLGDRRFQVLHLPGHSPGSIGLWEPATGTLFSGDAVYDGPLLDEGDDGDIPAYRRTMERLQALPVTVVHGGHDPSFGRERLRQLAQAYLARRSP